MSKFDNLRDYLKRWFINSDFEILKRDYGLNVDSEQSRLQLFEENFKKQIEKYKNIA